MLQRKKPKETTKKHQRFDNVVGSIFCKAIATQYEKHAVDSGCELNPYEKEFMRTLYRKVEKVVGRARRNIYVSL